MKTFVCKLRPCRLLVPVMAGLVLGCGTEPIGDVTGDYVLTAQFAGAASECSLTERNSV